MRFEYASESDRVRYPIPARPRIEGGSDRHTLMLDRDRCRLYELFAARREGGGWRAGSGAVFDLRSNRLRPARWTSADAAGLPILPGLARWDEAAGPGIDHALRFAAPRTRRAMILADNGSPWFITGAPDRRWDDDDLRGLRRITGRDLEVVDTRGLLSR